VLAPAWSVRYEIVVRDRYRANQAKVEMDFLRIRTGEVLVRTAARLNGLWGLWRWDR
jgi:hypothetical protein